MAGGQHGKAELRAPNTVLQRALGSKGVHCVHGQPSVAETSIPHCGNQTFGPGLAWRKNVAQN